MKSEKMAYYLCWSWIFDWKNRWICKQSRKIFKEKIGEHIPCGYWMSTIYTFDDVENKHTLCCWKDCKNKFCTSLREHATNVISFEKKKKNATVNQKKELRLHQDATAWFICWTRFSKRFGNDKNHQKVRNHCHFTGKYRGAAQNICNFSFNVANEISVVFRTESNCDYHFIIKELVSDYQGQFECLKANTKKYKTFSIAMEKEVAKLWKIC